MAEGQIMGIVAAAGIPQMPNLLQVPWQRPDLGVILAHHRQQLAAKVATADLVQVESSLAGQADVELRLSHHTASFAGGHRASMAVFILMPP
jgi:hypothetical protein